MTTQEFLEQQIIYENLKEVLQKTFFLPQAYSDFQKDIKEYFLKFLEVANKETEFLEIGKDVLSYQLEQQKERLMETYVIQRSNPDFPITLTISSTLNALDVIHITIPTFDSYDIPFYSSFANKFYDTPVDLFETDIIFYPQVIKVIHQTHCLSSMAKEQIESYYLDGRKILSKKTQELTGEKNLIEERFVSEGICFIKTRNTSTMKKKSDKPYNYFELYKDNYMDLEFTSTSTITRNQFDKRMKGSYSRIRELKK